MLLWDNDLEAERIFEDVLRRAISEMYELVMYQDNLPVSLSGINRGRSAAS